MKRHYLFITVLVLILTNCSVNNPVNDDSENDEQFVAEWHLSKVTGGMTAINKSFDSDMVIWTFFQGNSELVVKNNSTEQIPENELTTGNYFFNIYESNEKSFIVIDGQEYGQMISSNEGATLIIDQNINSSETFTDLYVLTFQRKLIPVDNTDN